MILPLEEDADVPGFAAALGLPGLVDVHTHFLPDRVMDKVWAYFDEAETNYGMAWPVHYRTSVDERLATLDKLGVQTFAPLVYPHKPGMGRWLTEWVMEFAAHTPGAVPTATLFPEPDVAEYLGAAVAAGARLVKVHVQVGGFDPRDPLLRPAWGLLAEAGVPAIVHCGHGPHPRRAHRPGRVRRGAGRATRACPWCSRTPACPSSRARSTSCTATSASTWTRRWSASPFSERPRPAARRLARPARRRRRPRRARHRLPEHPLPLRRAAAAIAGWAAADDRLGDAVPALGAARRAHPVVGRTGMNNAARGVILSGRPHGRRRG